MEKELILQSVNLLQKVGPTSAKFLCCTVGALVGGAGGQRGPPVQQSEEIKGQK